MITDIEDYRGALVRTDVDPFERLEEEAEQSQDQDDRGVYEAAVSLGLKVSDDEDDARWKIARLCALVGKRYGADLLDDFASAVNISLRTAQERKQVWNAFGKDEIDRWRQHEVIHYTHMRLAMKIAVKTEDAANAYEFLNLCVENTWRTGRAEVEADRWLKGDTGGSPEKLAESSVRVSGIKGKLVTFEVRNETMLQACEELKRTGAEALLKLFEGELPPPEMDEAAKAAR